MLVEESDNIPCGDGIAPVFETFPKIPRWSRDIIITEKLDGTNAAIYVDPATGAVFAASRKRWITPESDNFGFARWVKEHEAELREGLGPGRHFGEWWGQGIQRGYGLREKRFSVFNVQRWHDPIMVQEGRSLVLGEKSTPVPAIVSVVPVIYYGPMYTDEGGGVKGNPVQGSLDLLDLRGSFAAPGYRYEEGQSKGPEGIVIYHTASRTLFKKTLENDEKGKEE